ncbi:MAG TPA: glycosyltransferase [Thermoplasmata archaeon]
MATGRSAMRILRVDSWDGRPGGGQEYVRSVADELEAHGHPQRLLQLVSGDDGRAAADERRFDLPTARTGRLATDLGASDRFDSFFAAEVESFRPDLVHVHHFDAAFVPLARALGRVEVPVVFTAHDAELVCPISTLIRPGGIVCEGGVLPRCLFTGCHVGLGGPYNLLQRRVFDATVAPSIRAYLCPSSLLTRYLHELGYRPAVHLAPFARIPERVRASAYPPPEPGLPPTIGYIGRLEPYKGVHDLLAAVALLASELPNVRLRIAGEGPFRRALEAQARRLGLTDRIRWDGPVDGAAKEEWFRSVHVVAVPSSAWENFGLVALEALTRGRPVVASNFGGLPDVVQDGETGRLVGIARPDELAAALRETLGDPARAVRWGTEGRRRALERFTPERHVEGLLAVYSEVLAGRPIASGSEARDLLRAA